MTDESKSSGEHSARRFFVRGVAILLPSVLTIWILFVAYQFVQYRIAEPINKAIRIGVVRFTSFPQVSDREIQVERERLKQMDEQLFRRYADDRPFMHMRARQNKLQKLWSQYSPGLDLIGLIVAVLLIYTAGAVVGSFIGRRLYARGEELISRIPLIKQVYPSVKQVTEFLVGSGAEEKKAKFSRVVAVEYPRKGLWSLGLVTGSTLRAIADHCGQVRLLTVFIPSSPTPFTGYVITVPEKDTVDLPITIEQALRFTVTGGVIVPPSQEIPADDPSAPSPLDRQLARQLAETTKMEND